MNDEPILSFDGEHQYLSNFYFAEFVWDGIIWPTSEHAFQAAKVINREERIALSHITNPGSVKAAGKLVPLREDWQEVKIQTMHDVVYEKFKQNLHIQKLLLNTGNSYLEEGNTWNDTTWGVCDGVGANNLGIILMQVRDEIRARKKDLMI
jgi:hypothetical protein